MAPTEQITLYTGKVAPYAHRVEIALAEAKAEFTRYDIDLKNKPEWYLLKVNPAGEVPAIAYGGPKVPADQPSPESIKLTESLVLVEFIADLFPESGILPKDPVLRAKARLFIDAISTKFNPVNFAVTREGADPELLVEPMEQVQALLPSTGFAIGEFSAADIAIAPFLGRLKLYLENDLGFFPAGKGEGARILQVLQQPKLARFHQYWQDIEARPSFIATFDKKHILGISSKRIAERRAKTYGA